MNKINFTKAVLDAATSGGKRVVFIYDSRTRGLALCVTRNGAKTFYVYRRVDGVPKQIRIGPYPDLSIEQARRKADEINGQIAVGEDPIELRREKRQASATFAEVFALYVERHAKIRKRTWRDDEEAFRNHLRPIASRAMARISRADISDLQAAIRLNSGPYAANRTLALVRKVFNWAIKHGQVKAENPVSGIDFYKEVERDVRLNDDDLPRLLQAIEEDSNQAVKDFFVLLLFTGVRRSNLQMMRWEQLDFKRAVWRIPHTKNGNPQVIPLGDTELVILSRRQRDVDSEWVFPSATSKTGYYTEPRVAWERICKRAGFANVRMHDLRRTLASFMVDTGASLPVVGKMLGHLSPQSTKIYARLQLDPVRRAKEAAISAMLSHGPAPGGTANEFE